MAIAVCAVLCGADGPKAIHRWAVSRFDWLKQFLSLPNGTPSRDCLRRVLMALNPGDFQRCFEAWIRSTVIAPLDQDLEELQYSTHYIVDCARGRVDERSYFVTKVSPTFALRKEWPSIRAVGYAVRYTTHADGTQTEQVRYCILSDEMSASRFAETVRGHWQIEAMHWVLDVTFREDQTRSADRSLASNLSWLRRFALTMLRRHPLKDSLRGKMQYCMYNTSFLSEVLAHQ